ncbi:Septin-6 [Dissophora globulifera]|nr:Septin-6 [Dissophora globulifera]
MTATLPLAHLVIIANAEFASSLRLVLVGDTGVGKTQSRSLFLTTVPGQVQDSSPSSPDIASLSVQDSTEANGHQETNGEAAHTNEKATGNEFLTKGSVSTLEIPAWLLVSAGGDKASDGAVVDGLVPAENVVVHDFVGYGQSLDARQTIDRVDGFLAEQYVATRNLFGASITPLSTTTRPGPPSAEQEQPYPFLEQFLVDSPMAHSLPDACLYFVLYDLKPVDIVFMKRIMHHVNLIPILAKADTLSINQLWKAKSRILKQLEDNEIEFFRFGFSTEELKEMTAEKLAGGPPFALSTAELEVQNAGSPTASLTDLALAINEAQFAESHSDLSLLQMLLLGPKNRMLHQASVKKFLNRWRSDLGLPLEETTTTTPLSKENHDSTELPAQQVQTQQQERDRQEQGEEHQEQEARASAVEPIAEQEQLQEHEQQATLLQQPIPQQQLPASLQQQTYQPSSSYSQFLNRAPGSQDDEVAQVIKLNRAQSVIRSASPSAKIYTHGNIIPAVPSTLSTSSSPLTSPSTTPPPAV